MKLEPDLSPNGANRISRVDPGCLTINGTAYTQSLLLSADWLCPWEATGIDELAQATIITILSRKPEIVLFGTGDRLIAPHPALTAPLLQARVGFEVMDTTAACRTYAVLSAEHRRVVAALIVS